MQDERKFGKGSFVDKEKGLVRGNVDEAMVLIQVRDGIPAGTLYCTVAKEPLSEGVVKVGCHRGKGSPVACVGDILGPYQSNSLLKRYS